MFTRSRHVSQSHTQIPYYHFATHCTHVTRPQATSADYTAVHRRQPARLRPTTPRRCGSCAAALVTRRRSPARWSAHAPAATACKRPQGGAWCERRNGTASARWAPRLPGQPASRLHLQALVRAVFDHFDPDRRGLWVRHADTHAQANSYRPRPHPGRMSALAAAAAAQRLRLRPKFRSRRAEVSA